MIIVSTVILRWDLRFIQRSSWRFSCSVTQKS